MKLFLAFILGAVLMWGTALIETHQQHEDQREKTDPRALRLQQGSTEAHVSPPTVA